jgi:hypothetical protein
MVSSRYFAHALRAAVLTTTGSVLIAAPFLMNLEAPAIVAGVLVGAMAIALGLAGTEPGARGSLPLSAQAVYDRGLALGLLVAGGVFAAAGQADATVLFAAAGLATLIMTSVTRYSARTV